LLNSGNMEPVHVERHRKLLIHIRFRLLSASLVALLMLSGLAQAQQSRITQRIDNAQRVTLRGNTHPRAIPPNDLGRVAPALQISFVTLNLAISDSQQADLDNLLAEQQNPASPNYHNWLTPQQYADRFGVSPADLATIEQWLRGQGLAIAGVAQGRNWVAVSGTAAQLETAFSTELHNYAVDGETNFANSTDPSVPAAIASVVRSIRGLNDFRMKPAIVKPRFTSPHSNHYLAPNDFATIYDILPAYSAGINGSGQTIVIAGQTAINLSDIQQFQSNFNIPANLPQTLLVPGSNQGISSDDLGEADLDIEWSGAVARNATIIYVYSNDVTTSVQYAIDHNLAPVISMSYGSCELETAPSDAKLFQKWAQQANAQGITWVNATGDAGAADCDDAQNPGLAVDVPSSIPEVTGVGGTAFQEGAGQFWNAANDASGASVLSYIPETSWNDSALDGSPSAGGGGASTFFAKPAWQVGPGVPSDNVRHVPDVAFNASADHDAYLVYSGGGAVQAYGGTSAPTPAFAGVVALLNQYLVSTGKQKTAGLGNVNPQLYSFAQSAPAIFHDITTGDNIVTVSASGCPRRQTCVTPVPVGYNAGVGYDSATGLGSMDIWKLMTCWTGTCATVLAPPTTSLSLLSNLTSVGLQDTVFLTATATANSGSTPVGAVQFSAGSTSLGTATLVGSAGIATASLSVTGGQLPAGSTTITATYNGSSSSAAVTSSVTVNVRTAGSSDGAPVLQGLTDAASFQQKYSPGMVMAAFGATLSPGTSTAGSVPLPFSIAGVAATVNGVAAPLYYVSPGQLNVQIPYETAVNSPATLTINNNGQLAMLTFSVAQASPGIFMDQSQKIVPNSNVTRGSVATVYLTGAGAVTPVIATGAAPVSTTPLASLPAPQNTTVTVGNIAASTACNFCFIGIPAGLVGVVQINFQVPGSAPLGLQPVVVNVNGIASTPAYLNITN
jgi:uncharacterized protein (TIGR03437 family)